MKTNIGFLEEAMFDEIPETALMDELAGRSPESGRKAER
jgi:hypothetical protein